MVNTFHPELLSILDTKRLGKQRLEAMMILRALKKETKGWMNHPATKMWTGYELALKKYFNETVSEWVRRGHNNTYELFPEVEQHESSSQTILQPPWISNTHVLNSHKARLIQKDASYYQPHFQDLPAHCLNYGYIWPSKWTHEELNTLSYDQLAEPLKPEYYCNAPQCRYRLKKPSNLYCGIHLRRYQVHLHSSLQQQQKQQKSNHGQRKRLIPKLKLPPVPRIV